MKFILDFEARSDLCVADAKELRVMCAEAEIEVHLKNGPKTAAGDSSPLSVQIISEAQDIRTAKDGARDLIGRVLNALAFATNMRFEFVRILKIVDWTPGPGMREAWIFTGADPREEPHAQLEQDFLNSAGVFLNARPSAAVERALRWFRLGLGANGLEDQFQYFWFAMEIIAEATKNPAPVHDRCPKGHKLYCEECRVHPTHAPFAKQAIAEIIRSLMTEGDPEEVIRTFEFARNRLLHGARLQEIKDRLPCTEEQLIDKLGQLTWHAIFRAFPESVRDVQLSLGHPDSYVYKKLTAIAQVKTVCGEGPDGLEIEKFPNIQFTVQRAPERPANVKPA